MSCVSVYFVVFMLPMTLSTSLLISLFLVMARLMQCCNFSPDNDVPPKAKLYICF